MVSAYLRSRLCIEIDVRGGEVRLKLARQTRALRSAAVSDNFAASSLHQPACLSYPVT